MTKGFMTTIKLDPIGNKHSKNKTGAHAPVLFHFARVRKPYVEYLCSKIAA